MKSDILNMIDESLNESLNAKKEFWNHSRSDFFAAAELVKATLKSGNKILICGNGGSACDALHFAGELVNRYQKDRPGLSCIALTADAPLITCIANDFAFEKIFSRQVQAHGRKGDLLIGISTSGNSKNVIEALKEAHGLGVKRLALLGGSGGKIAQSKEYEQSLCVSSTQSTPRIQEVHSWILHSLCEYLDA